MSLDTLAKSGIRKFPRMSVDISVRVFSNGTHGAFGRGHDVGCGGMALYTPLELAEEDKINIVFELPASQMRFGVSAVVKNRNGFRYGIEFAQLTSEESAEIKRVTRILALGAGNAHSE